MMENKIIDAIKKRYSSRTFSNRTIPKETIGYIQDFLGRPLKAPFGSETSFKLVPTRMTGIKDAEKIGTYGFTKGAMYFIAGKVKKSANCFEDFGFVFEKIILKMTELGLGTCWLGGTFKRKDFYKILDCREDELIPAVTPLGYSNEKKGFRDVVMRSLAGSDKRMAWEELFFREGKPLGKKEAGEFKQALEMVRIAPSSSNNQPWRISMDKDLFHFYIKSSGSGKKDSLRDKLKRMDIGIAMYHFDASVNTRGLKGEWQMDDNYKIPGLRYISSWKRRGYDQQKEGRKV